MDAGVYDEAGSLVVSTGTTTQTTVSVLQAVDVTNTPIGPGIYYVALALDNTTGQIQGNALSAPVARALGAQEMDSAFVLPSTATFATMATALLPAVAARLDLEAL